MVFIVVNYLVVELINVLFLVLKVKIGVDYRWEDIE